MSELTLSQLPKKPGVYLMKDRKGKILYIGKAKNIYHRVRQYFVKSGDNRPMIPHLVSQVNSIETYIVQSEKEALLLENNLIKQHQPRYNVLLRDDKSYLALKINKDHDWPMVSIVRYRGEEKRKGLFFGPYTSAHAARETLDFIQRSFPLRQCSDQELRRRTRPCILYGMKRCIAPCVGRCTKEEYKEWMKQAIEFLKGNNKQVLEKLRLKMEKASDQLEFEKAASFLKTIRSIERSVEKQQVDKPKGQDIDVLGLYREGEYVLIAQLIFKVGRLTDVRHYSFEGCLQENHEILSSFLIQHYFDLPYRPKEILLSYSLEGSVQDLLSEKKKVSILVPKRGDKKALLAMAVENAKAAFHQKADVSERLDQALLLMQKQFRLSRFPSQIECFDNSNLGGSEPVSAMVSFQEGKKSTKGYRTFKIKEASAFDDYASMHEVLKRRYSRGKKEGNLPDLVIVDGGKGQLNIARKIFEELDIVSVDLISLAKEGGRHDKGATKEKVFLPGVKEPVVLPKNSQVLFLLQRIRDEAHRFALGFQKKRRSKQIRKSVLDTVVGIGPKKKKDLLKYFGSLKGVRVASVEEIIKVPGFSKELAEKVWKGIRYRN